MDLFGRKAQAQLSVMQAMLDEKDSFLNGAAVLLSERDKEIARLNVLISGAYQEIAALMHPPRPKQTMSAQPLYLTEGEEDLKYQLDHNLINISTYQQMLKELEFENAEVSLAVEDLPESFHY